MPSGGHEELRPAREAAEHIVRVLHGAGHTAYFAGGCVRDELLGLAPSDYDVATDALPDRIRELFARTAEVGAAFGVMLVHEFGTVVEVATFRTDGVYTDKRRPDSVKFGDAKEDAARRDYTVNALFLDPLEGPRGAIIDFVDGQADLQKKVLRAVGDADKRLAEDHLRGLRAARLAAKLGFDVERGTSEAIRRHASELSGVSRERIGDEIRRMVDHPSRAAAAAWLAKLNLEEPVFLKAEAGLGVSEAGTPTLGALPPQATLSTGLAAWAVDLGLDVTNRNAVTQLVKVWRRALCLSNDERDWLLATLSGFAMLIQDWALLSMARQKRTAATGWFEQAMQLVAIRRPEVAGPISRRVAALAATSSGLKPEPLMTGDELLALGLTAGPAFKRILDSVYDAQLEGKVSTLAEARELAKRLGV